MVEYEAGQDRPSAAQLKHYEQARVAHTRPSTGMGAPGATLQGERSSRIQVLAARMDNLVSESRAIADRLGDAVDRIHGADGTVNAVRPEQPGPQPQGVLGTLEMFVTMIEQTQGNARRSLSRLEEVG
jgi:hypothetical protein